MRIKIDLGWRCYSADARVGQATSRTTFAVVRDSVNHFGSANAPVRCLKRVSLMSDFSYTTVASIREFNLRPLDGVRIFAKTCENVKSNGASVKSLPHLHGEVGVMPLRATTQEPTPYNHA